MKIYEIIAFNREILDRIDRIGIRPGDHKYLALYDDYQNHESPQRENDLYCRSTRRTLLIERT